ncbi:MAG: 30S ribosomal protein S8 [Nanoarchaeota archaeon]|nr:30S ribosomal protein S8 [Nanoarchaeota archaeon]
MALNDPVADSLSKINNAVKGLHSYVILKKSKLLMSLLTQLKAHDYVGEIEEIQDNKQGMIKVHLIGNINKCSVIKPRYPIKVDELESYERKYLPAKDFGILLITTNKGILTQEEAKEQNVGGALLAYCY